MKDFKCVDCESVFDDAEVGAELFCPLCRGHLEQGVFQEVKKTATNTFHKKKPKQQDVEPFIFKCTFCHKSIRLAFPFKSTIFRCTNCDNMYNIQSPKSKKEIYVIIPEVTTKRTYNDPPKQQPVPEKVITALYLFDLSTNISLTTLKSTYKKCMLEYHPDRVAHLGADLKKLAEEKTKQYNEAFNIIQKYFKDIGRQ
jgi:pyruvate-formate lyase-activating enzyme